MPSRPPPFAARRDGISRLVPYRTKPETLFGIDRGKLEILGDIDKPPDVAWEAETGRPQEENF